MRPMVKPRVWIMSSIAVPNLSFPYFLWPGVGVISCLGLELSLLGDQHPGLGSAHHKQPTPARGSAESPPPQALLPRKDKGSLCEGRPRGSGEDRQVP